MSMKNKTYHKGDSTFYTTCRCNCGGNFQCIVKAHVKDGKVVNAVTGRTLWIDTKPKVGAIEKDLRKRFEAYYSVSLDNYPVQMDYLGESEMVMKRCVK